MAEACHTHFQRILKLQSSICSTYQDFHASRPISFSPKEVATSTINLNGMTVLMQDLMGHQAVELARSFNGVLSEIILR